jgi:regulator of sirC expression with transglutaminase-like and TPR domain
LVQPEDHAVLRDRGLAFYQLEAYRAALEDVREYLACVPDASDARQLRALLVELTQRCAKLN